MERTKRKIRAHSQGTLQDCPPPSPLLACTHIVPRRNHIFARLTFVIWHTQLHNLMRQGFVMRSIVSDSAQWRIRQVTHSTPQRTHYSFDSIYTHTSSAWALCQMTVEKNGHINYTAYTRCASSCDAAHLFQGLGKCTVFKLRMVHTHYTNGLHSRVKHDWAQYRLPSVNVPLHYP